MSGPQLTQSKYSLQLIVVLFGELLSQLEDAGSTRTYRHVLGFCTPENIDHLVVMYLNTGVSPVEEWAEEWLDTGEVLSSYTKEKDC
jgi:hydrogenase-4 membrane subunit HyfE